MKFGIVSTFSDRGYEEYAKNFVQSLENNLDKTIEVFLYVDNKKLFKRTSNINIINLEKAVPDLTEFKNRNKNKIVNSFMADGVRFSHKSYAIWHAAMNSRVDILIWLDADTELLNTVSTEYLKRFLPNGHFTSYLGRENYSETGFLAFDLRNPHSTEYFELFKWYYDSDEIYKLKGQLDCHVYDAARVQLEEQGKIKNYNLSPPGVSKNHFNHVFKGFMIHYKGDRKEKRDQEIARAFKSKQKK
jgi:hypothetical protein